MEAECLDRLIDPTTRQVIAAYGWVTEVRGLPRKFWVSIEKRPVEFFHQQEAAYLFYTHSIAPLLIAIRTSNTHKHKRFIPNCKQCKRD